MRRAAGAGPGSSLDTGPARRVTQGTRTLTVRHTSGLAHTHSVTLARAGHTQAHTPARSGFPGRELHCILCLLWNDFLWFSAVV